MIEVIGFGLAGACVALQLQRAGHKVSVIDDGRAGSSMVAAGLVNPVAGRNFEPSWDVVGAWEVALPFYEELGEGLFQEVPIVRLWRDDKDRAKFEKKRKMIAGWISSVNEDGVTWKGGGWLDCPGFLALARKVFVTRGGEIFEKPLGGKQIWCTGASGLLRGDFEGVEHRSAKGEILTVEVPGWDEERILNRNGWVIPIGGDRYRVGATYEWDDLESGPTAEGRTKIEELLQTFTKRDFKVINHVAGIRPIIERSRPVVVYQEGKGWMVNGLGSKGVIYAPRVGLEMAERISQPNDTRLTYLSSKPEL